MGRWQEVKRRSLSGKGEKQTRVIAREGDGLFCFVLSEETTVDMRDSGKLNREEKVENTGERKNPEMKVNQRTQVEELPAIQKSKTKTRLTLLLHAVLKVYHPGVFKFVL